MHVFAEVSHDIVADDVFVDKVIICSDDDEDDAEDAAADDDDLYRCCRPLTQPYTLNSASTVQ